MAGRKAHNLAYRFPDGVKTGRSGKAHDLVYRFPEGTEIDQTTGKITWPKGYKPPPRVNLPLRDEDPPAKSHLLYGSPLRGKKDKTTLERLRAPRQESPPRRARQDEQRWGKMTTAEKQAWIKEALLKVRRNPKRRRKAPLPRYK